MKKTMLTAAVFALSAPMFAAAADAVPEKAATCVACHGEAGAKPIENYPKLAGQHYDYLLRSLNEYKSGARKDPIMAPQAAPLEKKDMEELAGYFSRQRALVTKY